jgi:hypothetical protein
VNIFSDVTKDMIRREQNNDKDFHFIEEMHKDSAEEVGTHSLGMELMGKVGVDVLDEDIAGIGIKPAVCVSTFQYSVIKTTDIKAVVAKATTQVVISQVAAHEA